MRPLAFLVLLALAPAATAAPVALTIEARESGCPSGHTYCFAVTQGSLSDLKPGVNATVLFENKGSGPHELKLLASQDADASHAATDEGKAFASSKEDLPGGQSDTFSFTVPTTANGVYIFCGVTGHEKIGMWLESTARKSTPGLELPVLLGALAVLAAALRRQP